MIVFHRFQLRLALHIGFKPSLSIGIDGLFGKVVGTAASCEGGKVRIGGVFEFEASFSKLQVPTDTKGAPANPVPETSSISMPISNRGSDSFNSWLDGGVLTK